MPFENWETDNQHSPALAIILILIVVVGLAGGAYAVYKIMSPPSDPVEVTLPATLSKPTLNATKAVTGDTVEILTELSDKAAGVQVFFYQNNTPLGSAYTNSEGKAIYHQRLNTVGNFTFSADCIHV